MSGKRNTVPLLGMRELRLAFSQSEANLSHQLLVQVEWRRRACLGSSVSHLHPSAIDVLIGSSADPKLTALGEEQARIVNREWKHESKYGLSVPPSRIVSPMNRAMHTCRITFDGLPGDHSVDIVEVRIVCFNILAALNRCSELSRGIWGAHLRQA